MKRAHKTRILKAIVILSLLTVILSEAKNLKEPQRSTAATKQYESGAMNRARTIYM